MHFTSHFLVALSAASAVLAAPAAAPIDFQPPKIGGGIVTKRFVAASKGTITSTTTTSVSQSSPTPNTKNPGHMSFGNATSVSIPHVDVSAIKSALGNLKTAVPHYDPSAYASLFNVIASRVSVDLPSVTNHGKVPPTGFAVNMSQPILVRLDGRKALAKAYLKYTGSVPANMKALEKRGSQSSVAATPQAYDYQYLAPVTVGGQTLTMNFDTGSADFWTFSTFMNSAQTAGHDIYSPNKSSTAKLMSGYTWAITYGDGSTANGLVYKDKVAIGGVTVTSQAVEPAQTVSSSFINDANSDGLVGLGFSRLNQITPNKQTTWFDNVKGSLNKQVFTADLKKGAVGSYNFGYIDSSKYTGAITYTTVNTASGWWQFTASGYKVATKATTSSITGIVDTGTSLLLLDSSIVDAYWKTVSGAYFDSGYSAYLYPCSTTLPSFTVVINGYNAVVPGTYLNYGALSSTTCYGGMQRNTGFGISIFGDVFIKSQFIVFDGTSGKERLGFAAKRT